MVHPIGRPKKDRKWEGNKSLVTMKDLCSKLQREAVGFGPARIRWRFRCLKPEVRTTQSGTKIVNLPLATSESWNDKQSGERKELTEWHRVVIFNDRVAGFVEKFAQKGTNIYVEGKLTTRKWTDQQGRYQT
jgi:hypothetical protein